MEVAIQTLKAPELDSIVMHTVTPGPWELPYRHLRHRAEQHYDGYGNTLALGVAVQTIKVPKLDSIVMYTAIPGP